ncbi:unnamed protein product [Bathycoccus prasinos]
MTSVSFSFGNSIVLNGGSASSIIGNKGKQQQQQPQRRVKVVVSASENDEKAKVKSYLDAGKKTKNSVGLRNSFYAGTFTPMKFAKSGTQFYKSSASGGANKKKFQAPKKKPLMMKPKAKPMISKPISKIKPISFAATTPKKKSSFAAPKPKRLNVPKKKKPVYTPFPALKRSGPPVKSQYTIKKQPIKPVKQIVNSRGKVATKAPATKRAQTLVFSNIFASLSGGGEKKTKKTASPAVAPPPAAAAAVKIALPVQMKKKEEQKKTNNDMSRDEIGTYGLIAAFSLASFSSLVVLPVALGDVFELIGLGVSAYFVYSLVVKDDDLGLSKTLDEVESQTGLDVRELTNSTVGLVKDTVNTVSSNTKKTSYPKKSETPKPVVAAAPVESEEPKEDDED